MLDLSRVLSGPSCGKALTDLGADVIKIESPEGDLTRTAQPRVGGFPAYFAQQNCGKRCVSVDLRLEAGRDLVGALAAASDVVLENFRPGVLDRLGLGYEAVRARNPKVVYCSITGYGQDGPKRDVAGHDLNYIAETGLLSLSMGTPSNPVIPPALMADIAGGSYPAVINILLALRERDLTGRGRHLDVSMTDNLFTLMMGSPVITGGSPRYRLYATKDGRMLAVGALEHRFWETFCEVVGLEPRLRDDSVDPAATVSRVAEIVAGETAETWARRIADRDCCCSIVTSVGEAVRDPHFIARELFPRSVREVGEVMSALPVPIDRGFRADTRLD